MTTKNSMKSTLPGTWYVALDLANAFFFFFFWFLVMMTIRKDFYAVPLQLRKLTVTDVS